VNAVSSLADTWINIGYGEKNGKKLRELEIIKSRGMGHSNEPWNIVVNDKGVELIGSKK
jgi:circadian clock protein KaiC